MPSAVRSTGHKLMYDSLSITDNFDFDNMTSERIANIYHSVIDAVEVPCRRKLYLGATYGSYDVCDDEEWRLRKPCLVYSIGINNDFSFDDTVGKLYGCEIHSFDPSMSRTDVSNADVIKLRTESRQGCCSNPQECVPEVKELKNKVHREIDEVLEDGAILASSTSFMIPSGLFEELKHRNQAVVVHPTNPPYFAPFTEIVPSQWTEKWVMDETKEMLLKAELSPVVLKKEIEGFALNRIQDAIFMESYQLVKENILSVEDIDKVMTDGLGRRYAFVGPWENAHLNSEGLLKYLEAYGQSIYNVQKTFKSAERMVGEVAERMQREICERVPLEDLEKRRKWRNEGLIQLSKIKRDLVSENN